MVMLAGFMASDVENVIGIDALTKTGRWCQLKYVFIFIPIPGEMIQFGFFKRVGSTINWKK